MIATRSNLDRNSTIAHPRNAPFTLSTRCPAAAGFSELRITL